MRRADGLRTPARKAEGYGAGMVTLLLLALLILVVLVPGPWAMDASSIVIPEIDQPAGVPDPSGPWI